MEKAYQDYLTKKAENTAKMGNNELSKDEIEAARYQIRDARLEYRRAKRDFAYAMKERHTGGKERLSIDKNDVHKKIKHHKVEIDTKAVNMSADEFNAYLENLVISTTPVNPNSSKEAVQEAKNNLKEARKNYAAQKKVSREEKVKALTEIDAAKEKVAQSKRDLVWFNYIEKKMLSTKKALARIYEKKKGE